MSYGVMAPLKEPAGITKGKERPADILVPNFQLGKDLVVDIAVTDSLQPKYLTKVLAGDSPAELYATEVKENKHKSVVNDQGLDYAPFVMETTGALNHKACQIVSVTAGKIAQRFGTDPVQECHSIFRRLAVVLQRNNAAMIHSRTRRDAYGWWKLA